MESLAEVRTMTPVDMLTGFKKKVVYDYLAKRNLSPEQCAEAVASSTGHSLRTINRYKKELGFPQRSVHSRTYEEKDSSRRKALVTRHARKEYSRKVSELDATSMSNEEYSSKLQELANERDRFCSSRFAPQQSDASQGSTSTSIVPKRPKRGGALGALQSGAEGILNRDNTDYHEIILTPEDQALYDKMKARG
jgi:hypothetical protein